MQAQKESDIQKQILDYLRYKHIFCFKHNNIGIKKQNGSYIPSGMKGVSDILGLLPDGKFLAIEVKRPKGIVTEYQQEFIEHIKNNKGLAFVAYSLDDVMKYIDK